MVKMVWFVKMPVEEKIEAQTSVVLTALTMLEWRLKRPLPCKADRQPSWATGQAHVEQNSFATVMVLLKGTHRGAIWRSLAHQLGRV